MNEQRLGDYLDYILQAIERIQKYSVFMTYDTFLSDTLTQDAVIRNFENIGEASRNITRRYPAFAADHPDLPLALAYEMRNRLAHGYFDIDLGTVWKTIENQLPKFHEQVSSALKLLG